MSPAVDPAAQHRALVLLGVLLAWVGGFVDGVGYLLLSHVFVAHQSGNTVASMVGIGTGDWSIALRRGIPIALFVLGVALGAAVLEIAGRRRIDSLTSLTLGAEALLLVGCLVAGASVLGSKSASAVGFWPYLGLVVLLVLAMGLQTATLRRIGRRTVRTTYVTGMLTHFAEEAVAVVVARGEARRDPAVRRDPAQADELRERSTRLRLLGAIWCCYAVGGVLGALAESAWAAYALAGPVAVLAALVAADQRRPWHAPQEDPLHDAVASWSDQD